MDESSNIKLRLWNAHPTWEGAEREWDESAAKARAEKPLKGLKTLPQIPDITPEAARNLRWKTLCYMLWHDKEKTILKGFCRHPFRYGWNLLRSWLKTPSYTRDNDFFLYGVSSVEEFERAICQPDSLLVVGFSYCHKPFECPSGRFTKECIHARDNPVCRQCFIGKAVHALPEKQIVPLFIVTIHHIGAEMFRLRHAHPDKKLHFLITACALTLEMGGDLGNMIGATGIGVRLGGRICNTLKAFELSEMGIKPGLTVVADDTQVRILQLLRSRRKAL